MMSRKDYEMLAAVIRSHVELHARNDSPTSTESVEWLVTDLAVQLAAGNPRFDHARFLAACGVSS